MPDIVLFGLAGLGFGLAVLVWRVRGPGRSAGRPRRLPPAPRAVGGPPPPARTPGATADYPIPPSPWAIEQAELARAARARAAKAKGWAQFDPKDPTDSIEGVYEAGTETYDQTGRMASFTAEQLAQGQTIRRWHPYWKADLSSYIYHYTDLLDASGELIAQHLDAEDIT